MDPPLVCWGQAAVRITWPEELGVDGVERGLLFGLFEADKL